MKNNNFRPGMFLGIFIGTIFLTVLFTVMESQTFCYRDGYYEAYKQFKDGTLEQKVNADDKIKYETELIIKKYKIEKKTHK